MEDLPVFRRVGKHNARWKAWKKVGRGQSEQFFLEHREAVWDTLTSPHPPTEVLVSVELYQRSPLEWQTRAGKHPGVTWYLVELDSLNRVVSVPNCSGVVGVYEARKPKVSKLLELPFLLVCWELTDPGNLGTLLRTVNALTGGGVVFVGGCSPWSSKVARSSAGALFRAPLCRLASEEGEKFLADLSSGGFQLLGTFPRGGISPGTITWEAKSAVFLGNESRGLPPELREKTTAVSLEMLEACESLNVAALGSILCYEWQCSTKALKHG